MFGLGSVFSVANGISGAAIHVQDSGADPILPDF
jgi:hypothetical protein